VHAPHFLADFADLLPLELCPRLAHLALARAGVHLIAINVDEHDLG
jgi:hypothetical protein